MAAVGWQAPKALTAARTGTSHKSNFIGQSRAKMYCRREKFPAGIKLASYERQEQARRILDEDKLRAGYP
jgi:hypothetical protein